MVPALIVIVLLVVAFVAFKAMSGKGRSPEDQPTLPQDSASQVDTYRAAPSAAPQQPTLQNPLSQYKPVGTPRLDDPDAERPQLDSSVLSSARAVVPSVVPDSVLADALLDTTPEQVTSLLSRAPDSVVREAFGSHSTMQAHQPLKQEERSQLKGVVDAFDDLDIWSYGDKN